MKTKPLLITIAASAALLVVALSIRAQSPTDSPSPSPSPTRPPACPVNGWAENLVNFVEPSMGFPVSDTLNNPATDCAFHQWAWEAFIWATAMSTPNGPPRFLSLTTTEELGKPAAAKKEPKKLVLKPRTLKPKGASPGPDDAQAGGGLLVDQNGQVVWYSVHMNDVYAQFVQKYSGMTQYNTASDTLTFPVGAAVFKASWQVVSGNAPPGVYTQTTTIPMLVNNPKGGIMVDPSGKTRSVTVALVGLHVVGVTDNHPEFLWATFEQINNAPDLVNPNDYNSPAPVSPKGFTFYAANTPANACNPDPQKTILKVTDPVKQTVSATPMTNVFRQYATGGEDATGSDDIKNTTAQAQSALANMGKFPQEKIWANYKLIGTTWLAPGKLAPGISQMETMAVGSVNLANATLETYFQGPEHNFNGNAVANCFMCHNTGGSTGTPSYPGKDINLSHQLLATLGSNTAVKKPAATPAKSNKH
jgi:hypothetical protein